LLSLAASLACPFSGLFSGDDSVFTTAGVFFFSAFGVFDFDLGVTASFLTGELREMWRERERVSDYSSF
jgi:hypothetical protein